MAAVRYDVVMFSHNRADEQNQRGLHYVSYLEWPKYKTAKPLQYTAYRTRNEKQLVRK